MLRYRPSQPADSRSRARVPLDPAPVSKKNKNNYKFSQTDTVMIVNWMRKHLSMNCEVVRQALHRGTDNDAQRMAQYSTALLSGVFIGPAITALLALFGLYDLAVELNCHRMEFHKRDID